MIGSSASGQSLDIGALPQGSPAYGVTLALAGVVGENSGLSLRPVAFDRSSVALTMVEQDKLTMAVASSINAIFALHGLNDHTSNKLSNL
jgi:hypothetical protein